MLSSNYYFLAYAISKFRCKVLNRKPPFRSYSHSRSPHTLKEKKIKREKEEGGIEKAINVPLI
jgi:hypothetical protein